MDGLLNTAPCGFIRFVDNGEITMVNATLLDILGYEERELLGTHIDRILPVASRIFYQTHLFPLLKLQGRVNEMYFALKRRDGQTLPMLVNAARQETENGLHVNDCVFIQMRQRNEYEDEILAAKRKAEQAATAKDEFFAMVSHELRTPLSAIRGWSHMLNHESLEPSEMARAHEAIDRSSEALRRLIEDLLDYSRIISGKMRITLEPIDITSVIRETLDIASPVAAAKDISIETLIDTDLPPVSGDAMRLQQVLWNLLSNAIKFTPKHGRVQVRVRGVNSSVEVSVSDTGEGISPDFLPYVFDRFRQADSPGKKDHGGMGLGMAISRNLVELHGGTIRAESPGLGQGATFSFRLPVLIVHGTPEVQRSDRPGHLENIPERVEGGRLEALRILVVEDDPGAREMLVRMLEQKGASVFPFSNGSAALARIEEVRPDILISDVEMREGDGHFVIRSIRALNNELRSIPAIALTAQTQAKDRIAALRAGYQMHVAKPVDPVELLLAIANLTNHRSINGPGGSPK